MFHFRTMLLIMFVMASCKEVKKDESVETESNNTPEEYVWKVVEPEKGSLPVARHEAAFVQVGDKFYLLGGRDIRPVSIYDTKTKIWTKGEQPPIELHHFQPVVYKDKIFVISALTGGWPDETPTEYVYIYDPDTDKWSQGHEIPEERRRGSTGNVLHGDKIYVACGIKNGHIGDHKNWLDVYHPETGEWEVLADAPRPRDHFQAVLANGKIYAPAGRNTGIEPENPFGGTLAEVDVYDIESNTWETLNNPLPTMRAGNAALLVNDEVWVVGGESSTQEKAHEHVEALNLNSNEWHALPPLNQGRHGTGLILFKDEVYIASGCGNRGGNPELDTMEKYGPKI
ncbi:kelch repeat-containing protein [Cytophaga sp. FL35]|uniref:Kelch repeat-containing protein n=1 Tax=Cytophaga sp. FL35 TaxID=1904456 RepID=UPI001653931B|nr:kelch repeat-containing protein [Cytophaga sp. FL35]MBC6999114.1 galactose oxidase [Cytophaga sp. FL35]